MFDEELLNEIIYEINTREKYTMDLNMSTSTYVFNFLGQKSKEFGMITLDMLKREPYKTQYINEFKNHIKNHNKINKEKKGYILENYMPLLLTDEW